MLLKETRKPPSAIESPTRDARVERLVEFLRIKPDSTALQAAKGLGIDYDRTDRMIRKLVKDGRIEPLQSARPKASKLSEAGEKAVIADLRNTIDTFEVIAKRNSTTFTIVRNLNAKSNARANAKIFGRTVWAIGLNPEDLPELHSPMITSLKQQIMKDHDHRIAQMLVEFGKKDREMLEGKARARIWDGLKRYHDELMSPQHFVMLVTKRVIYDHISEAARNAGIVRIMPTRTRANQMIVTPSPDSDRKRDILAETFERHSEELEDMIAIQLGRHLAKDLFQEVALTAYTEFDHEVHTNPRSYIFQLAVSAITKTRRRELSEKFGNADLYNMLRSESPHIQNRPKATTNYYHFDHVAV